MDESNKQVDESGGEFSELEPTILGEVSKVTGNSPEVYGDAGGTGVWGDL